MADDNKKEFSIDVTINPFGEFNKKGLPPEWFAARPKLMNIVKAIDVKRSLKLDARKWKKKDLENGVYAVAKYDLALFSTALKTMEKGVEKAFDKKKDKQKRDAKYYKNTKTETKDETAALSNAEKKVTALWNKVSKSINDKVSLALDEVAADKGDNKKAIAVGKQALKVFNQVDTSDLFANPINDVLAILKRLSKTIEKAGNDKDDAFKAALRDLRGVESDYDLTAKSTGKVAKMFLALGDKMSKEKSADAELQKFGAIIAKDVKSNLEDLKKNIKDLGKDLDALVNFVAKGDHEIKDIDARAADFKSDHEKKKGSAKATIAKMNDLAKEFKKIERKLK